MRDHARTCYHEAGHAVVLWALSAFIAERIEVTVDGTGKVVVGKKHPLKPLSVERETIVKAAGFAAELKYEFNDCHTWSENQRFLSVVDLLLFENQTGETDWQMVGAARRQRYVLRKTNELIDEHWPTIEKVAKALHKRTQVADFETISIGWMPLARILLASPKVHEVQEKARRRR